MPVRVRFPGLRRGGANDTKALDGRPRRLALACLVAVSVAAARVGPSGGPFADLAAAPTCQLNGKIKHVIFTIFDNVHFLRDRPNVPSDLQQMPHLLNFIRGNGTLLTNDHTVLISHTANGILTNLTGMYSDRHGQAVSNSFRYFKPDGTTLSSSSFKYWTTSPTTSGSLQPNA